MKMSEAEIKKFKEYVPNLKGSPFITESNVVNQKEAVITYAPTQITEAEFKGYWESGDAINKVLMEEPFRLMREFPALQKVKMTVNNGKVYSIEIDRTTVEDYLKVNFNRDS